MKKSLAVLFASLIVFTLFGCTKGSKGATSPFRLGRGSDQPADGKTMSDKTYSLGDPGPADGIIFYDKKEYTNGWRYLEAAPASTEFNAEWGPYTHVAGTEIGVGSGKRNTELIVAALKENGKAAQLCANLEVNGHKDWFLPSMGELDLIFTNLKLMDLGGFKDDWYWSSSASEYGTIAAWAQRFSDGSRNDYNHKGSAFLVRAVRAF
jgi:hypothetical protein